MDWHNRPIFQSDELVQFARKLIMEFENNIGYNLW